MRGPWLPTGMVSCGTIPPRMTMLWPGRAFATAVPRSGSRRTVSRSAPRCSVWTSSEPAGSIGGLSSRRTEISVTSQESMSKCSEMDDLAAGPHRPTRERDPHLRVQPSHPAPEQTVQTTGDTEVVRFVMPKAPPTQSTTPTYVRPASTGISRGRDGPSPLRARAAPRTDPSERDYRTGLLPWVCGGEADLGVGVHHAGEG
jgi:hypothetical protein